MTKLTYWKKGPTQELPNQLVLQTGHRNTLAKSVPWTPNATKCCKWTCCSDLPIWQALYQPGMVLLPRWTTEPKNSPNQPPTIIYKTAAKEINRPRSQDNTPGRQFGPQVKQSAKYTSYTVATVECRFGGGRETRNEHVGHCWMTFWRWPEATAEVFHSAVAITATAETTFGSAYMFVPSFAATAETTFNGGLPVPHLATTETTFGGGWQKLFPLLNLFLPNMEVFLH